MWRRNRTCCQLRVASCQLPAKHKQLDFTRNRQLATGNWQHLMSKPVIIADGLSKSYRIGVKAQTFPTFRDAIIGAIKSPLKRLRGLAEQGDAADTFWAVKDVSFE